MSETPRSRAEQDTNDLAAMILAAGASRRFGKANKLQAELESGISIVENVLQMVASFSFRYCIVVSSPSDQRMPVLVDRYSMELVTNEASESGIGSSIACGAAILQQRPDCTGVTIFLGDMPFIKCSSVSSVVDAFIQNKQPTITRPTFHGQAGHPVIFPFECVGQLTQLKGDQGARQLISAREMDLRLVETFDPGVLRDIDTPEDLAVPE